MADIPALILAVITVAGGGTVLAAGSNGLPAPRADIEQSSTVQSVALAPVSSSSRGAHAIVIPREDDGLFYVDAMVNGAKVRFLIDTGSNTVVLSPQDAARAGVAIGDSGAMLETAGGSASSSMTRVGRIAVAGHKLSNVGAVVASGGLKVSLLGQNVLSELGEMRISRSTMTVD